MKHIMEIEIRRTFEERIIPSLEEVNQSFQQYVDSLNALQYMMSKRGIASTRSSVHVVSQFLSIYHEKINVSTAWVNKEKRVTWIPIRIHMLRLPKQIKEEKMGRLVLRSELPFNSNGKIAQSPNQSKQ